MYLVDTSLWIQALRPRGNKLIQDKLRPLILAGSAHITDWIILELMTGIKSGEEQKKLEAFLAPIPRLAIENSCWKIAWDLAATLRKKGITPSAADSLIAAIAIKNEMPLLHVDQDFSGMAQHTKLKEVNWIEYLKKDNPSTE